MARPIFNGYVIPQINMHHNSPGKNKDYRITIAQCGSGSAGSLRNGKEITKCPITLGSAEAFAESTRDAKRRQTDSYSVLNDLRFAPPAATPAPVSS